VDLNTKLRRIFKRMRFNTEVIEVNVKLWKKHEMVVSVYLLPFKSSNFAYFPFLCIKKYIYNKHVKISAVRTHLIKNSLRGVIHVSGLRVLQMMPRYWIN
jgi:hypothetical protein